jgi:hypothetical protein
MTRLGTFNGNQFDGPAKWRSDLLPRMAELDRLDLQEAVHLDAKAFVADPKVIAKVGAWAAIQTRNGDNDGRANTAILYRPETGKPSRNVLIDLGRADGSGPDQHTRERYLCAALFPDGWDGSFHGFPERDAAANPHLILRVGEWVKSVQGPVRLGADINKIPPAKLEAATGLKWHGIGIDGFLGDVSDVATFPEGFSDHAGVHAVINAHPRERPVKRTLLERARELLRRVVRRNRTSHPRIAKKAQGGLNATRPTPKPAPVTPSAPHGFMPGAIIKNIPPGSSDPAIIPAGVIQHIAVSSQTSLFAQFSNDGGIESHFYIRKDGTIEQYRSIYFEADAQFAGNSFGSPRRGFISVEHQGGVGADLNVPMPKAQLDAFHRVIKFVHSEVAFPLRVCPAWNQDGVGYHALFVEWNTNHHSCPGAARIKQFHDVTVPWLRAGGR